MGTSLLAGVGSFRLSADTAVQPSIRVFYACPPTDLRSAPIVIAMHGMDRAAEAFRDEMAEHFCTKGRIVLVPEFDVQQFPDAYAYNFGGVCGAPPDASVLPRERWNFGIIDRLFDEARLAVGSTRATFALYGNSAGAQYVLRYLALMDAPALGIAVASNSGAFMLPDLTQDYPVGMGGLGLDDGHLRRYFGRHLTLLIGSADDDIAAPGLPRSDVAMAQGPHRLARAHWYFEHCNQCAGLRDLPFGWTLEVVKGAGHVSPAIYERAAELVV